MIRFEVEAYEGERKIGDGRHARGLVNVASFEKRLGVGCSRALILRSALFARSKDPMVLVGSLDSRAERGASHEDPSAYFAGIKPFSFSMSVMFILKPRASRCRRAAGPRAGAEPFGLQRHVGVARRAGRARLRCARYLDR